MRPHKKGLDYFSHSTDSYNDLKVKMLRAIHGNTGYAFYFFMLEQIYKTEDFSLNFSDNQEDKLLCLALEFGVKIDEFKEILNTCIKYELFDHNEYINSKSLTSSGIKRRAEQVLGRRLQKRNYNESKKEVMDVHNSDYGKTEPKNNKNNTKNAKNNSILPTGQKSITKDMDVHNSDYGQNIPKNEDFEQNYDENRINQLDNNVINSYIPNTNEISKNPFDFFSNDNGLVMDVHNSNYGQNKTSITQDMDELCQTEQGLSTNKVNKIKENKKKKRFALANQKEKESENKSEDILGNNSGKNDPDLYLEYFNRWNLFAVEKDLPVMMSFLFVRQLNLDECLEDPNFNLDIIFEKICASDFLLGKKGEWKGVTFDWIMKNENYVKILEDQYADSKYSGDIPTNVYLSPKHLEQLIEKYGEEGRKVVLSNFSQWKRGLTDTRKLNNDVNKEATMLKEYIEKNIDTKEVNAIN